MSTWFHFIPFPDGPTIPSLPPLGAFGQLPLLWPLISPLTAHVPKASLQRAPHSALTVGSNTHAHTHTHTHTLSSFRVDTSAALSAQQTEYRVRNYNKSWEGRIQHALEARDWRSDVNCGKEVVREGFSETKTFPLRW